MSTTDLLNRSFNDLKESLLTFSRNVSSIDGNFESKYSEIKTLETKIEKLKDEQRKQEERASIILSRAGEEASKLRNEANELMRVAVEEKQQADELLKEAQSQKAEANHLIKIAQERQTTADNDMKAIEEKKKRLEAALR